MDISSEAYYLTVISVLRWMIDLGRFDIIIQVPLLSSHVALPREGYLDAAVHDMAHVGEQYNSRLMYDPSYPEIDHSVLRISIRMPMRLYP